MIFLRKADDATIVLVSYADELADLLQAEREMDKAPIPSVLLQSIFQMFTNASVCNAFFRKQDYFIFRQISDYFNRSGCSASCTGRADGRDERRKFTVKIRLDQYLVHQCFRLQCILPQTGLFYISTDQRSFCL